MPARVLRALRSPRVLVVALLLFGLLATSAAASGWLVFTGSNGEVIAPGNSVEVQCSGCWHSGVNQLWLSARVQAYSGTWLADSSGTRTSADAYCSTPACTAYESWSGSYPAGYAVAHNHGNGTDTFDGEMTYN